MTDAFDCDVLIVGAGPAGLMAADRLAAAGFKVIVCDAMASPGRKFLLAGRGGLNLTHASARQDFLARYGQAADWLAPTMDAFPPAALRAFVEALGVSTYVGSSGRLFPVGMKASPLLRAWLARLAAEGVEFRYRMRLTALAPTPNFETPDGGAAIAARAVLLALGGASWPRLGSTGAWVPMLEKLGVAVAPLTPANVGVSVDWSPLFADRFEGAPLKRIALSVDGRVARGEAIVTREGLEGGVVYAVGDAIRAALAGGGAARLVIDLKPDMEEGALAARLQSGRRGDSLSNLLRKQAGLAPVAIGLLRESGPIPDEAAARAARIKAVQISVTGARPIEKAISSAGGITAPSLDEDFMLRAAPGVFAAGEMLDWEAPTGGFLLQATMATGWRAAAGIAAYLGRPLEAARPSNWAIEV